MQHIHTHIRWFQSFRGFGMSIALVAVLFVFALTNASLFLLAQKPQNVQAQDVPTISETVNTPATDTKPAETTPAPAASAPAPQTKTVKAAVTPAPAYDKVSISSIGLSSRFVTVGLTNTNAIDVSPTLVGWWNGSAQPGTPGAAFLDGHNPGVFSKLPKIQTGADITITRADGETFHYTVVHIETVQLAGIDMYAALTPYGGASEGLNLMTCVGTYNPNTGTTDQRLVVYAVRS